MLFSYNRISRGSSFQQAMPIYFQPPPFVHSFINIIRIQLTCDKLIRCMEALHTEMHAIVENIVRTKPSTEHRGARSFGVAQNINK